MIRIFFLKESLHILVTQIISLWLTPSWKSVMLGIFGTPQSCLRKTLGLLQMWPLYWLGCKCMFISTGNYWWFFYYVWVFRNFYLWMFIIFKFTLQDKSCTPDCFLWFCIYKLPIRIFLKSKKQHINLSVHQCYAFKLNISFILVIPIKIVSLLISMSEFLEVQFWEELGGEGWRGLSDLPCSEGRVSCIEVEIWRNIVPDCQKLWKYGQWYLFWLSWLLFSFKAMQNRLQQI